MRRFTCIFLAVVGGFLALVCGFNLLVDPYDVGGGLRWRGFNLHETQREMGDRRVYVGFHVLQPHRTLLAGNSRVSDGFRDLQPPWGGTSFNAGMPSGNAFEMGRVLTLQGRSGVDCVVLALEAQDYDSATRIKGDFWLSPLLDGSSPMSSLRIATSEFAVDRGIATVTDNLKGVTDDSPWQAVYSPGEQRRRSMTTAREYWSLFSAYHYDPERVRFIGEIVDRLTRRGVQVIGVFTPLHAWANEAVYRSGAVPTVAAFRRDMVSALERSSGRSPRARCVPGGSLVLWDFSGFQPFSASALPDPAQTAPDPSFFEVTHFTPAIGRAVLSRVAGQTPLPSLGEPFGVGITGATLAEADRAALARRQAWLSTSQGQEATRFFDEVAARGRPRPVSERFYLTKDDWRALDRDLPRP